jgi:hypothetical protein
MNDIYRNIAKQTLLVLLLGLASAVCSQVEQEALNLFSDLPTESFNLETDRNIYFTGENLWFKIDRQGLNSQIPISNVINLELLDSDLNPVVQKKYNISKQFVHGSFIVPHGLICGNYYLRVFTQYQRNFPAKGFTSKIISIYNPEVPYREIKNDTVKFIELFPEFGSLIDETENKLAFVVQPDLLKMIDSIVVISSNFKRFYPRSYADGFGLFALNPSHGIDYYLFAFLTNKDSLSVKIEKNKTSKVFARIEKEKDSIIYSLNFPRTEKNLGQGLQLKILNISGQAIKTRNIILDQNTGKQYFNASSFEPGIYNFVLSNSKDSVIDNTAFFNPAFNTWQLETSTDKSTYAPREKVQLLLINPFPEKARNLQLSISVVKNCCNTASTALPYFVMQNPFLLNHQNWAHDNGLLVQSQIETAMTIYNCKLARAVQPDGLFDENKNAFYLPEIRETSLSGVVLNKTSNLPENNIPIIASVLFSEPQLHIQRTNPNGEFVFSFFNLFDNKDVFLSTLRQGDNYEIKIKNDFGAKTPEIIFAFRPPDSTMRKTISESYVTAQLSELYQTTNITNEEFKKKNIFEQDALFIRPDDYVELSSVIEIFHEIVPFARIRSSKNKYEVNVLDPAKNIWHESPLILLDNIPISDPEQFIHLHPSEIERIGIVNKTFVLGENFIHGIVLIETKSQKFSGLDLNPQAVFVDYKMFSAQDEFSAPRYNSKAELENPSPDFRNTLYWSPNFHLTNDSCISFFTSDQTGQYDIIVKGIDENNKTFYAKKTITVSRNK